MKVVYVRWQDAAFISSQWKGADDLGEHTAFQLLSAGLLVWENREGIWLATDYAPDDDNYRYTCFIPKRLIIARGEMEVRDMPLPKPKGKSKKAKQKNVGKVIDKLEDEKPGMPKRQKVAIALNQSGLSKKGRKKR